MSIWWCDLTILISPNERDSEGTRFKETTRGADGRVGSVNIFLRDIGSSHNQTHKINHQRTHYAPPASPPWPLIVDIGSPKGGRGSAVVLGNDVYVETGALNAHMDGER